MLIITISACGYARSKMIMYFTEGALQFGGLDMRFVDSHNEFGANNQPLFNPDKHYHIQICKKEMFIL